MTDNAANRHGTLAWFEIHVSDLDVATNFYGRIFGWTFKPLGGFELGEYLLITTRHGASGNGGIARTAARQPTGGESSILYLEVDDIPAAIDAALAAGGVLHRPRMNIGGQHGFCAIVQDPDGNYVGLWSDH